MTSKRGGMVRLQSPMPWKRRVSRRRLSSFHILPSAVLVQPSDASRVSISSLRDVTSSCFSARW